MGGKVWSPQEIVTVGDPAVTTLEEWLKRLPGNTRTFDAIRNRRKQAEYGVLNKVALPFFRNGNPRYRKMSDTVRKQTGRPRLEIPDSDRPRYDVPMKIPLEGGILILPDIHIPYQDGPFLTALVELAVSWKIRQGLLAGDTLNLDAFSRFIKEEGEDRESFQDEIAAADAVFVQLRKAFKKLWWLRGNHERRITMASVGQLGMWTLQGLLGQPDKLQVTEKQWAVITTGTGANIRVTHPNRGRMLTSSWARQIAATKHQHVVMAHSHQTGMAWDISGKFWTIDTGCCTDPRKLHYVWQDDKPLPEPRQGAVLICARKGKIYPYLVTPDSDFEAMGRMYGAA